MHYFRQVALGCLCDFSTTNKQALFLLCGQISFPIAHPLLCATWKKKLIHRNLCNFCTWGGVLRILVAYIIVILFMRSRWQELSCYCICSCIDWRVPFLSATVCWNKWCSLLFIINIPWCWYYKWCFSELICWNNQLWRWVNLFVMFYVLWWLFHKLNNHIFWILGALVASNLMDKQGRKKLLIGSYLGMVHTM